jgi:AcrR family transcriptional regulator
MEIASMHDNPAGCGAIERLFGTLMDCAHGGPSRKVGTAASRAVSGHIGTDCPISCIGMNATAAIGRLPGRKPDKRVTRTRHQLLQAFIDLMKERGWDDIRVGDVCTRAGLARSTFYVHHASKERLLISALDAMRDELRSSVEQHAVAGEPFGYARALLHNAFAHPHQHRLLVDRRTDYVVQRRFLDLVKALVAKDLAPLLGDATQLEPVTHYISGGLFELMTWGVKSNGKVTVDEVIALFLQMVSLIVDKP